MKEQENSIYARWTHSLELPRIKSVLFQTTKDTKKTKWQNILRSTVRINFIIFFHDIFHFRKNICRLIACYPFSLKTNSCYSFPWIRNFFYAFNLKRMLRTQEKSQCTQVPPRARSLSPFAVKSCLYNVWIFSWKSNSVRRVNANNAYLSKYIAIAMW